jgi:hypothetical protein
MRLSILLAALLGACEPSDVIPDDTDVAADTDVAPPPTFDRIDSKILRPSCGFSSCHGAGGAPFITGNKASDYANLVNAASNAKNGAILVIPGDPDGSYLIQKLEGAAGIEGERMPPPAALTPKQIQEIRDWIAAGAKR